MSGEPGDGATGLGGPAARDDLRIVDAPDASRWEARIGDALAGSLRVARRGGAIVLVHTEVDPAFEGRGIGSALARRALDDARARGLRVRVECPFVRAFLERHPEAAEGVALAAPR